MDVFLVIDFSSFDGLILKSQACLFSSKKSIKKKGVKSLMKLLSKN